MPPKHEVESSNLPSRTSSFNLYIQPFPAIPFPPFRTLWNRTRHFTLRRGDTARSDFTIGLGGMKNFNEMSTGKFIGCLIPVGP